ncbi:IS3 family transposase [Virgibacillus soli]
MKSEIKSYMTYCNNYRYQCYLKKIIPFQY